MRSLIVAVVLLVTCSCIAANYVVPEKITASPGEGFVMIVHVEDRKYNWTTCLLTRNRQEFNLLEIGHDKTHQLPTGELVRLFDPSECGVRVQQVNSASGGRWDLVAISSDYDQFSGESLVTVTQVCSEHIGDCPLPYRVTESGSAILECQADSEMSIKSCLVEHFPSNSYYVVKEGELEI